MNAETFHFRLIGHSEWAFKYAPETERRLSTSAWMELEMCCTAELCRLLALCSCPTLLTQCDCFTLGGCKSCLLSLWSGSKLRGLFIFSTLKTEDLGSTRLINSPQNQISLSLGCEWPGTQRAYGPSPGSSAWLGELGRHQGAHVQCFDSGRQCLLPQSVWPCCTMRVRHMWGLQGQDPCGHLCHWSKTCPSLRTPLHPLSICPGDRATLFGALSQGTSVTGIG